MSGAVIELGMAEPWEPEQVPPPRWPPRVPAWLLPVVVVGVTLLSVTAAAPQHRWDPVLALSDGNSGVWFGPDDTAYVATQRSRGARLQAYRPGATSPQWTVTVVGGYAVPIPTRDPGLTLMVFDSDPDDQGDGNAVEGRDPETGALIWTRTGVGLLGLGSGVAIVSDRKEAGGSVPGPAEGARVVGGVNVIAVGGGEDGETAATGTIEAVDRQTGRARWTRPVPADVLIGSESSPDGSQFGDRAPFVVELRLDGLLRLSDPVTGEVRRETRLTLVGAPLSVWVTGGQAVVYQQQPDSSTQVSVTYDITSGAELSRLEPRSTMACGERYLCESEPSQLTVTDADSGAVLFRGRGEQYFLDGHRLTVSWEYRWPQPAGTEVYDLRTRRRLHTYPGWRIADFDAYLMTQELKGGGLLVGLRADGTGQVTVVGRATGWTGTPSCSRGTRYVGCVGVAGLRIWRLPSHLLTPGRS